MKISPNNKKLLITFLTLLAFFFVLYVFLEIQVENLQNKVDEMSSQQTLIK